MNAALSLLFSKFDLAFLDVYIFSDTGHQLYNYKMTLLGEVPLRDFGENWAPGTFYLNALAFKIFGVSIYSTKLLLAICMVISATALFCIARKLMPEPVALAVSVTSLLWGNLTVNTPFSGWFANCFGLIALWAFFQYLDAAKGKTLWLAIAGVALGLTISFKQHIGVLGFGSIAFAVALNAQTREAAGREATEDESSGAGCYRYLLILFNFVLLLPSFAEVPPVFWTGS